MLIPDNERAARSLRLNVWLIRSLFVLFIVVAVLIVFGASTYWRVAEIAIDYGRLQEENANLKKGLEKVEQLQADLDRIKKFDQKLRKSLSGYVSIIENNDEAGSVDDMTLAGGFSQRYRSIFNSIPDIFPVEGFITRRFESNTLLKDAHLGIDIAAAKGSPVKATANGQVIFAGWTFDDGNVVIIKHDNNFYSYYKHNLVNYCRELQWVRKGEVIGLVGGTGEISSGPHLHFEIWKDDQPVNPLIYLGEGMHLSN